MSDESEIIHDDAPCIRCRYNLKMLERMSRCPECGLPIAVSLDEKSVLFSPLEKAMAMCVLIVAITPLLCPVFLRLSVTATTSLLAYSALLNIGLAAVILKLRSLRVGWRMRRSLLLIVVAAVGCSIFQGLMRHVVRAVADI